MDKAVKKTFVSNLRKMRQQKTHNYLVCEFTAHYSCRNEEMKPKSTMTNWFIFQTVISLIESWGVWPGLTVRGKWGEKGGGGGAVYDSAGSKYSAVSGLPGKKLLYAEVWLYQWWSLLFRKLFLVVKKQRLGDLFWDCIHVIKTLFVLLTVLLSLDLVTMYLKELRNVEKMYPLSIDQC